MAARGLSHAGLDRCAFGGVNSGNGRVMECCIVVGNRGSHSRGCTSVRISFGDAASGHDVGIDCCPNFNIR